MATVGNHHHTCTDRCNRSMGNVRICAYAATLDAHGEGAALLEDRAQRLWRTQDYSPEALSDLAVALDQVKIRFYANRVPLSQRINNQAEAATRKFYEAFP